MRKAFWKKPKGVQAPDPDEQVKVSSERPPIWDDVCGAFKIDPVAYFTYGDTIYNPSNLPLLPEIVEHEKVHMEQQNHNDVDAALWWGKYLRDPAFRVDQEARAYARQYDVVCGFVRDRNMRNRHLMAMATSLSGPLYNKAVSQVEAMTLIKKYSKTQ